MWEDVTTNRQAIDLYQGTAQELKLAFIFPDTNFDWAIRSSLLLYETQPVFREAIDSCHNLLNTRIDKSLLEIFDSDELANQYQKPAFFAFQYALSCLWQAWGISPSTVMGNSVGEYVAATVAGIFTLEDALKLLTEPEDSLKEVAREVTYAVPRINLFNHSDLDVSSPEYWCSSDKQTTDLAANCEFLKQQGHNIFLSVSPSAIKYSDTAILSSLSEGNKWQQLLETLAELYVRGAKIDWLGFYRGYPHKKLQLPTYPWQRKRHWFESQHNSNGSESNSSSQNSQIYEQLAATGKFSPEQLQIIAELTGFSATTQPEIKLQSLTQTDIQTWLCDRMAQELGVKPEQIDVNEPFDSYGLDSVLALEIASAGQQVLGLELSPLMLVSYPTIASLSQHLAKEIENSETEMFEI